MGRRLPSFVCYKHTGPHWTTPNCCQSIHTADRRWMSFSAESERVLGQCFDALDRDKNGVIEASELKVLGRMLRAKWDADANANLLVLIDQDQSGTIDLAEFRAFV